MKILLVGSDKVWAIERFYHKYLNEWGAETDYFLAQSIFYDYYQKNIVNKVLFKFGLSSIYTRINKAFEAAVLAKKPDVIFIFKGMEILPESITWAKEQGVKVVGYNPDNPFIFTGKGSGNINVTRSIGLYDLHFTYNTTILKKLQQEYRMPVAFLPFGYELSDALYEASRNEPEVLKVCFLGNPDIDRAKFISEIAEDGIQIDVYGNDWNRFINHSNIRIFEPIYGNEFWKVLHKYRVQLNLMRIHNPDSHNMRTFEVPGVGGILLAPDTEEHRSFFEPGKEIFLYTDVRSCIHQLKTLLELDEKEATEIRNAARFKSVEAGYSYKARAKQVLETLKELTNK